MADDRFKRFESLILDVVSKRSTTCAAGLPTYLGTKVMPVFTVASLVSTLQLYQITDLKLIVLYTFVNFNFTQSKNKINHRLQLLRQLKNELKLCICLLLFVQWDCNNSFSQSAPYFLPSLSLYSALTPVWPGCLGKNLPHFSHSAQRGKKWCHSKNFSNYNAILVSFFQKLLQLC